MKSLPLRLSLATVLLGVGPVPSSAAAETGPPAGLPPLPSLSVPRAAAAPVIDGDLSDEAWARAAIIPALLPASNAGAEDRVLQSTVVRVLWDEEHLYVAFDCRDDDIYSTGTLRHDDDLYREDVVEVFLDGFGDGRQFVEIQVAPDGTNLDLMYLLTSDAETAPDLRLSSSVMRTNRWGFREWEMQGLVTAARKTEQGWSAELAIPAETIMKRKGSKTFQPTELRVQFVRYDWVPQEGKPERRLVQQNWSPVKHGNPHNSPALMGRLVLAE